MNTQTTQTSQRGLAVVFGAPARKVTKAKRSINIKNPFSGLKGKLTSVGSTATQFVTEHAGTVKNAIATKSSSLYNKATDVVGQTAYSITSTIDGYIESMYHAPGVTRKQVDYTRNNGVATIIGTYENLIEENGDVYVQGRFIKNEFSGDAEIEVIKLIYPSEESEPVRIGDTNHNVVMAPVMKEFGGDLTFMYKFVLVSLTDKSVWLLEATVPEEELAELAHDLAVANQKLESLIK